MTDEAEGFLAGDEYDWMRRNFPTEAEAEAFAATVDGEVEPCALEGGFDAVWRERDE